MSKEQALAVFEDYKIRRQYDEQAGKWFFSVMDVVAALIQQRFARENDAKLIN